MPPKKSSISKEIELKMGAYPVFYQKVWKACASIPKGEVRTYGQIAHMVGSPKSARAVGNALKMNPFAPIIPCHRVVGSNNTLGGYSGVGGLRAKKKLLESKGAR